MRRRLLSMLLVLAMVLSMLPVGALADEAEASGDEVEALCWTDAGTNDMVVRVTGRLSEGQLRGLEKLTVVAAAYGPQRLLDSAYTTIEVGALSGGSLDTKKELHLNGYGAEVIQVFLLDQDLQPICDHPVEAGCPQGESGDLKWSLSGEILTLTGTGDTELTEDFAPWSQYGEDIQAIYTVKVKTIAERTFMKNTYPSLRTVELGEGLETIGQHAFFGDALRCLALPASLRTIGDNAFSDVTDEAEIILPDGFDWNGVTVGEGNGYVETLKSMTGKVGDISWQIADGTLTLTGTGAEPAEMTDVSDGWKTNQDKIEKIVTVNVASIADGAFQGDEGLYENLSEVELGEGLETIGAGAFQGDYILKLTLPASLRTIGDSALSGVFAWTEITLRSGFDWNQVTVGTDNGYLNSLKPIRGELGDISWTLMGGVLTLTGQGEKPVEMTQPDEAWADYKESVSDLVVINVKNIPANAFQGWWVSSVDLGEGLETIGDGAFQDGFIVDLTLPSTLKSIGDNAFDGVSLWSINTPEGFDWSKVTIGEGNDSLFWMTDFSSQALADGEETTEPTDAAEETEAEVQSTGEAAAEETEAQPVEEAAAEETEDLTGYYIAPEGAQLQDDVTLEEMAAFTGADKTGKGTHTASFTGLVPYESYIFIASRNPGSLEKEDLQAIGLYGADAEGKLTLTYCPKEENGYLVQLYGPAALTLTVEQDYVTLHPGESFLFAPKTNGKGDVEVKNPSDLLTVTPGEETGTFLLQVQESCEAGSYYFEFATADGGQTAAARVRVDVVPQKTTVQGVTLGETKLTRNIYDSEATQIPMILDLKVQAIPEEVSQTAALDARESGDTGSLIRSVEFTDETLAEIFSVCVQDDHTLLLNTSDQLDLTDAAAVKAIKSSYKVAFKLTFAEGPAIETAPLTLTVQKKLPTIRAAAVTLNPYYSASAYVTFTGGQITAMEPVSLGDVWAECIEGNVKAALVNIPQKAATVNLSAQVTVEGYNTPVKVTIPVKVDVKAPTLKLGMTSWTVSSLGQQSIEIPIWSTTKNLSLEDLDIQNIQILRGKDDYGEYYTAELDGDILTVTAVRQYWTDADGNGYDFSRPAGKENLTIRLNVGLNDGGNSRDAAAMPIDLKFTVDSRDPVVKLNKSQTVFNMGTNLYQTYVEPSVTLPADSQMPENATVYYAVFGKSVGRMDDLFYINIFSSDDSRWGINLNDEYLFNELTDEQREKVCKDTFTMYIDCAGRTDQKKGAALTIRLLEPTDKDPKTVSLTAKATGSIDLIDDESAASIAVTFKNLDNSIAPELTIKDSSGNDCGQKFISEYDTNGTLRLRVNPQERPGVGTYTVKINTPKWASQAETSVNFQVVQKSKPTARVTGRLDSTRSDSPLTVTCNYRKEGQEPNVQLWTTGKTPQMVWNSASGDPALQASYAYGTGAVIICANPMGETLLAPGKYTLKLVYPDGTAVSAAVTVTQTAAVFKLGKTSTTLHPRFTGSSWVKLSMTNSTSYSGYEGYECYKADGRTEWNDQDLIEVSLDPWSGVTVTPTGVEPEKDTTVKVKLFPDSRIPGKFTWLTVKVLGGKNLTQKITLKANALDPSHLLPGTDIQCGLKGFDNQDMAGNLELLVSRDNGKTYEEVDDRFVRQKEVYGANAGLSLWDAQDEHGNVISALDSSLKYRVKVTYGTQEKPAAEGTLDLKLAYGSNRFTVAKAPTLYRKDATALMDIHLDAKSLAQQIGSVTIKGSTDFRLTGSQYDWVLRYTGNSPEKLKTTTLTLQIFLKGNETSKPNATTSVKVTVK